MRHLVVLLRGALVACVSLFLRSSYWNAHLRCHSRSRSLKLPPIQLVLRHRTNIDFVSDVENTFPRLRYSRYPILEGH
jgi:hypothetical protein